MSEPVAATNDPEWEKYLQGMGVAFSYTMAHLTECRDEWLRGEYELVIGLDRMEFRPAAGRGK